MSFLFRVEKWRARRMFTRLRKRETKICRDLSPSTTPWIVVAMHDVSGRRGLWYREVIKNGGERVLQMCSGREGDDAFCEISISNGDTGGLIREVLSTARWAIDIDALDGYQQ